ncbi:hypothetical protein ACGFXC_22355 [Streptomyces sp. NPDC048507]|uniref:hypothetical protein n=1 Tax=Streptomyces sp. NPDC048507 TaxID=3365560 RepID=UPI003715FFB7
MHAPYKHRRRIRAATATASAAAVTLLAGALLLAAAPDGGAHADSWTGSVSAAPATPQALSRMNERTILQVRFDGR